MATDRTENPYDRFAEINGWRFSLPEAAQNRDILFYVALAREVGGPVLELGCGWGRVMLALARARFAVTGVDLSERMLAVGREKMCRERPEVLARVCFLQGDMTDFSLSERFPLVLIPFNSLQCLRSVEEQRSALACAVCHLERGGRLALEVNAGFKNLADDTTLQHKWTKRWVERNLTVLAYERVRQDRSAEATIFDMRFELRGERGRGEVVEVREALLWASQEKTEGLLRETGLRTVSVFSDFKRRPLSPPEDRLIFIVEHTSG